MFQNPSSASSAAPTLIAPSNGHQTQSIAPSSSASSPTTVAITLTQAPPPAANLLQNGTVLVAFFAFVGVLITVWSAHLRMRRELRSSALNARAERNHSRLEAERDRIDAALEAHKERISTTRRQVYLEAIESLAKAQAFLGGLAADDLGKLDVRQHFGPLGAAVGKVGVVGEMPTVLLARELLATINEQLFRLMPELLPLAGYRAEAGVHQLDHDAANIEVQRILAAMRAQSESGAPDQRIMEALRLSFKVQQERAERSAAAAALARSKSVGIQVAHGTRIIEVTKSMALQLDDLMICLRAELGIETDAEALRTQTRQMQGRLTQAYAELSERLQMPAPPNDPSV